MLPIVSVSSVEGIFCVIHSSTSAVDFYTEVQLIWDIVCDVGVGSFPPGKGFPPGFEYRWADSKSKVPVVCSGPEYVGFVLNWIESEINDVSLFPTSACKFYDIFVAFTINMMIPRLTAVPFPKHFIPSIKVIYTRIFRIFAIVYSHHFSKLEEIGAVSHLNTSFKHFLYFIWEFNLLQMSDLEALSDIVGEIRSRYEASGGCRK